MPLTRRLFEERSWSGWGSAIFETGRFPRIFCGRRYYIQRTVGLKRFCLVTRCLNLLVNTGCLNVMSGLFLTHFMLSAEESKYQCPGSQDVQVASLFSLTFVSLFNLPIYSKALSLCTFL